MSKLPEHTGEPDCPACAEIERLQKEVDETPYAIRMRKMSEIVRDMGNAMANDFPEVKFEMVFLASVQSEKTDLMGIHPQSAQVISKDPISLLTLIQSFYEKIKGDLVKHLGGKIFTQFPDQEQSEIPTDLPFFNFGKPGQA